MFDAIVFAVYDCGFVARSSLESEDSTEVRVQKLYKLIAGSKYGIHDISRTTLDPKHRLPRFNMPLELGIFLGAKMYGPSRYRSKRGLVLDRDRYRYQKYCSDISGQDVRAHQNQAKKAIHCVRNWLRGSPDVRRKILPGADHIFKRYRAFRRQLPELCQRLRLDRTDLHFNDYTTLVSGWLRVNPR